MKWKILTPSSLEKLVSANKPVYVLNTSSMPSGDKGMIVVNFYDGTRREFFKMPPTFIPMAISDVIPHKKLTESRDFKQCLVKGMLTLVDPDQAEDFLATSEAQEEYENLVLSEHSQKARNIDVEQEVAKRGKVTHNSNESHGPQQDVAAVDTISNKVRGLVEEMNSKTKTPKQVLIEMRRHQTALSAADISYVIQNSPDAELSTWAQGALAEVVGVPSAAAKKSVAAPAKKAAVSKKKTEGDFDFGPGEEKMTAEEAAADARARAAAADSQSLNGESRAADEINKILGRK